MGFALGAFNIPHKHYLSGINQSHKMGNPAYEKQGLIWYLPATKAYVSLGVFNGAASADPEGILEGKGKKLRHIEVSGLSDIHGERISAWVREAVALNQRR